MAHYAFIDENNLITEVIVGRDENETVDGIGDWEQHYAEVRGQRCLRTSYNTRGGVHYNPETGEPSDDQSKALRFNYAGVGFTYDEERDAFIPPKPYPSWVLDEATCLWESPVSYPEDGESYTWNEETQEWTAVENETE
jgi:hypothetical protein